MNLAKLWRNQNAYYNLIKVDLKNQDTGKSNSAEGGEWEVKLSGGWGQGQSTQQKAALAQPILLLIKKIPMITYLQKDLMSSNLVF